MAGAVSGVDPGAGEGESAWEKVARADRAVGWLTALCAAVGLAVLALGGWVLAESRADTWRRAEQETSNLALALERDISHDLAAYDRAMLGVLEARGQPGLDAVPPGIRRMALFDRAAESGELGAILLLGPDGRLLESSDPAAPVGLDFSGQEYVRAHRERADPGLHVSRPYASLVRAGETRIALSRRVEAPGGGFGGAVVGAMRQEYFAERLGRFDLGPGGVITVIRADGRVLARNPFRAEDLDRDLGGTENFRRVSAAPSGAFVSRSVLDGVERLYAFRRVEGLPLILNVAVSTDGIFADWNAKARVIGALICALDAATVGLCLLFRREIARRLRAEARLVRAARGLAADAARDALTGLGNRRRFDRALAAAWEAAAATGTPASLILLDADRFKAYNDRHGHPAGDRVLAGIGRCIRGVIRQPGDTGARYGGEEFAVLLPGASLDAALEVAERLRAAVQAMGIPHEANPEGAVTASLGVACLLPEDADPADLVRRADRALYRAKAEGRNRVVACPGDESIP